MTHQPQKGLIAASRNTGAALIGAMLTVSLVAILSANAFWQQWRSVEVQTAGLNQLRASWLLTGTLDWGRAKLHEDGRLAGGIDHLGEAWAQEITDIPLSAFMALGGAGSVPRGALDELPEAFVSLQLSDAQARMNVINLIEGQSISAAWMDAFGKLFAALGLPATELDALAENLRVASAGSGAAGDTSTAPLLPQQAAQLTGLGLTPSTLKALEPHITVLPVRTPINLNSASVEVMAATVPGFTRSDADRVAASRKGTPLQSVADAGVPVQLINGQLSVVSRFFEFRSALRMGPMVMTEQALLQREGLDVRLLWHRRPATPVVPHI
ncbi:MAG TPA: type II secretion system minor pseudopilin GspK [Polaromonas sp.]|uniref:type II secretion system minor pseudopilin GspK n=1 Tax=Polaromonas sp. TaxID=1869339 RepID=UPI002D62199C|nr:type II secretion system minor pseudopilin GspK [Polaromonas sp.]HYW58392.1 type II secretion system minor pseudopilin GspK [Polaromonas sp.]